MNLRTLITFGFVSTLFAPAPVSAQTDVTPSTAAGESPLTSTRASRFADSVLALMTLEEKLGQLVQNPGMGTQTGPRVPAGGEAAIRAGRVGSFLGIFGADYTRELQRIATTQSRLRIPLLFAFDVIHGFRTIYPASIAEAASFDPSRVEFSARQAAIEATAHGLHWTFSPMVDIARDPRWGRVVEGAGEDPFLGSAMAAARVRGFQGGDSAMNLGKPGTMLATVKHFAAYGGAEGGRDYNTVELSERTLWETYFPPYLAGVTAGAATVMASFNDIGGRPSHANAWLLTDVLRGRWGFKGLVVSDWTGIAELVNHHVAATNGEAAVAALRAGVDVDMSDNIYIDSMPAAVRAGRLSTVFVDSSVHRLLRLKYMLGLFDNPYRFSDAVQERHYTLAPEHLMAARIAAREAIVLLKNANKTLPLRKDLRSIAVIGALATDAASSLGPWAADGRAEDVVTVVQGIRNALGTGVQVVNLKGAAVDTVDSTGFAPARSAASQADAVVLVLGERSDMSGEASSRASIELPGVQLALAREVLKAARTNNPSKPVVVVLMNGRPLAIPELDAEMPAIVESWFLGVQHGNAIADVLFGDYNPGGKLPATFPRLTGQIPIYYNHRNTGRPADTANHYTSKYVDASFKPLYPFGYGLSYSQFTYSNLRLSAPKIAAGDSIDVSVDVGNSSDRAGDEVVQLYIRDEVASIAQPVKSLQGFKRITLQPGQAMTVTFRLRADALALYDSQMQRVVEPGWFSVFAGTNSDAALTTRFEVTGGTLVLAPPTPRFR